MANLLSGLMGAANAGEGYLQGQQTAIQNNALNQSNQIGIDEARLQMQMRLQSLAQQQALSDDAIKAFNPLSPGGQTAPAQGGNPPQMNAPAQVGGQSPDPTTFLDTLARNAAGRGDLTNANQLWTNAANLRTAQANQYSKEVDAQDKQLKIQAAHYSNMGQSAQQLLALNGDTPGALAQWKMQALSDPNTTPQEKQNISNIQWAPGIMDRIANTGMTTAQAATQKREMLRDQNTERHQQIMEDQGRQRIAIEDARQKADAAHKLTQKKVGVVGTPSSQELREAAPIVAQALYGENADQEISNLGNHILYGPNSKTTSTGYTPDYNTPALIGVVSQAKQLMKNNTAISFPQAIHTIVGQMKANGEFAEETTPAVRGILGTPLGAKPASTVTKFKDVGNTQADPIPLPANKSDLIPGKWYVKDGKVQQWPG